MDAHHKKKKNLGKVDAVKRKAWYENLVILQCPIRSCEKKHNVTIHPAMFENLNQSGLTVVCYMLFKALDQKKADELFKHCYPCYDKKDEREFHKVCVAWLKSCAEENTRFQFPRISNTFFMSPGGPSVNKLLFTFSNFVIYCKAKKICPQFDNVMLPPLSIQGHHIEDFQRTSIKSATCSPISEAVESIVISRRADYEAQHLFASMLSEYRDSQKWIEDAKQRKKDLLDKLKITKKNSLTTTPFKKYGNRSDEMKSSLRNVRNMWKVIDQNVEDTAVDRQILEHVLESHNNGHGLSKSQLPLTVPATLLKECNQEILEKVGGSLFRQGCLDPNSLLLLLGIALKQILLRLHNGLPNYESSVTVSKAQNVLQSRNAKTLREVQRKMESKKSQVKQINKDLAVKLDELYRRKKYEEETLIPGLPVPDFDGLEKCNTHDQSFDLLTLDPPLAFCDIGEIDYSKHPIPTVNKDLLEIVIPQPTSLTIPSTSGSKYEGLDQTSTTAAFPCEALHSLDQGVSSSHIGPHFSDLGPVLIPDKLAHEGEQLPGEKMNVSCSSLKQGELSFGPFSPLKEKTSTSEICGYSINTAHQKSLPMTSLSLHVPNHSNSGKYSTDSSTVIEKVNSRKDAMEKLVDQVVDFTLQETDILPGIKPSEPSPFEMNFIDISKQLDCSVFDPADKTEQTPPKALVNRFFD